MNAEPSKLAELVIAYYEKFQWHVPEAALRDLDAIKLALRLQESLATGVPISEARSDSAPPMQCGLRLCILRARDLESATPRKTPDGEWLQ